MPIRRKFAINATTGVVTFVTSPDFEAPTDAGANNVYDLQVTASDGTLSVAQSIAVTVTAVNDNTPVFTSAATANFAENATGHHPDGAGDGCRFAGTDA